MLPLERMTFDQVAVSLQINKETVRQTYKRIEAMLAMVESGDKIHEMPAVLQKYPLGSDESEKMKALALQDNDHRLRTFPEIAQEAEVDISPATAYRMMNKYHNLFCYKRRSKPPLDAQNKLDRLALVDWGLAQPIESFVFSDEMIFEGEDPYASATPDKKKSGFSIMVSGSIALGFKGPLWVWVKESAEEQAANNQQLQRENNEREQRVALRRLNATIPGTEEYLYLQALNWNIAEYNANCSPHEPHRIPRRPFWEFGEKIQKRSSGGGLDWFLY
ncbi:hypothetical protein L873DRAFT_1789727 [Choiromyces venosus 120613-1]|uniref:Tc1-like transposase DDE domain-containing protein n=1 Tax=Choiromyces venosus 120613-1 TaxID=1336337 RepID=A0A3N4K0F3_9PEZI|nr:hypothetical protein L873DRAFT_1789727 [Choiromyces venosus 120613-1]